MSRGSKSSAPSLMIKIVIGILLGVSYALTALLFEESILKAPENIGTKFRPAIFLLALSAILFGPIIGMVSAGLGNLLFDLLKDSFIEMRTLDADIFVGLIANGAAGFFLGLLAHPVDLTLEKVSNKRMVIKNALHPRHLYERVFLNTLQSILLFGGLVASVIAIGDPIVEGTEFTTAGLGTFEAIFFWNSVFLLMTMPVLLLSYSLISYWKKMSDLKRIEQLKVLTISYLTSEGKKSDSGAPSVKVISARVTGETEFITNQWNSMRLDFRSQREHPVDVRCELASHDILRPDHFQVTLEPRKVKSVNVNVYPLKRGTANMVLTIKVLTRSGKVDEEIRARLDYRVNTISSSYMGTLVSFALLAVTVITFLITLQNTLAQSFGFLLSPEFLLVMAVILTELFLVLGNYMLTRRNILKRHEQGSEEGKDGEFKASKKKFPHLQRSSKKKKRPVKVMKNTRIVGFLVPSFNMVSTVVIIGVITMLLLFTGYRLGAHSISPSLIFFQTRFQELTPYLWLIGGLLFLLLVNETLWRWHESREHERKRLLREASSESPLQSVSSSDVIRRGKPVELQVRIQNVLTSFGLRCIFSSFTPASPSDQLVCISKGESAILPLRLFPQKSGKGIMHVDFYPAFDERGNIVPIEGTEPLHRTSFQFFVQDPTFLGIDAKQFKFIRKVFGYGLVLGTILSIGMAFLDFNMSILQLLFSTVLPVFFVFQVPILFIHFSLRNRLQRLDQVKTME